MPTWKEVLKETKESESFKRLLENVNDLYRHKTVYPPKEALFRAFELTPYDHVRIVILGQDPYHQRHQANGLAFSVNKEVPPPPSLKNIYKELNNDLGIPIPAHGDLTPWAREGVLLLNTTLTVEDSAPAVHRDLGWERFTDAVITALDRHDQPLVFMLWGAHARSKETSIDKDRHLILKAAHPSPLSAYRSFFGCRHFSKANRFLEAKGRGTVDFSL